MSKAVNSPTARLLQSSRLFSLPRPLPSPELSSTASVGAYRTSETATTPYPTHQAIVTTQSSLHRGDWGLKRPLPGKKLRGTKPTVRIRAQDTWEHVTSFESAGDHVRTLQKWNEMGVPMMQRKTVKEKRDGSSYGGGPRLSVYDDGQDTTDRATAEQKGEVRWKYDGPWLDGMQEGDFQRWMIREVGKRHGEWKEYLCNMEVERKINAARMNARHEGESLSEADIDRLRVTAQPTDQEFAVLQKRLRDGHERDQLSSDLTALITNFLDLPSLFAKEGGDEFARMMSSLIGSNANGAPSTHPGAGLSHLRTNAIMENHPIHGPQAFRTPVEARVLRPRGGDNTAKEYSATLGVAGMAAEDAISGSYKPEDRSKYRPSDDPAANLDPESETGGKVWVRPQRAWIDDQGRVRMALVRADDEAVKVKLGDVEDIHASKNGPSRKPQNSYVGQSAGANYGTALPRSAPSAARSGVQGFDEELSSSVGSSARQQLENLLPRARAR